MLVREDTSVRVHDLLEIDAQRFVAHQPTAPEWVAESLRTSPYVVVRRGPDTKPVIPVGVRGVQRNHRWPAYCLSKVIKNIHTPPRLLERRLPQSRVNAIPALRALRLLKNRWRGVTHLWGPGGSVGFEIATGLPVVKAESDLDIVLYAEKRITVDEAKSLCKRAMELPVVVDMRVETRLCAFSLWEYASESPRPILLRSPTGVMFRTDPWSDELPVTDTGQL